MRRPGALALLLGLAALWIAPAGAQAPFGLPSDSTGKDSPAAPPGVAIPDQVDTRLGTLRFFGGFPDAATADTLFDNLDFERAVQAYLLALPVVSQAANRDASLTAGPANATVPIWETGVDARTVELTANNSPYAWIWLDLRGGPIALEVPPNGLGTADDLWYRWVGDLGVTGPDRGRGGKYLFLPPGYTGPVPQGYFLIRPGSNWVWVPWISFPVEGDPNRGVDAVKEGLKIYTLGNSNPPKLSFVDMSGKPLNLVAPHDFRFWELLNAVVQHEPTDEVDATTLGFWNAIGIAKGRPFAPDERMTTILTEAAIVGDATARAIMYRWRGSNGYWYPDDPNSPWRLGFVGGYTFSEAGARLLDGYAAFFFYATVVAPSMDARIVGEGPQYLAAFVDSNGDALDGGKTYRLHLPGTIPVRDSWSIVVYDNQTRSMAQTDQQVPGVGSQTKDLKTNADGSIDVWFGPKAPAGSADNWVETVPGCSWNAILRLHGAEKAFFDKTWRPGEIEPAQ